MQHQIPFLPQFEEVNTEQPDIRMQLQERLEKREGEVASLEEVCIIHILSLIQG